MLRCFAVRDDRAPQIGVQHLMELLVGRLLEQGEREHARIVDEDVQPSERRESFGTQMLHLADNGDIRLNRERVAVCGLDIGDDSLGAWSVTREVHDDGGAGGRHRLRDAGSDALAAPVTSATLAVRERVIGVSSRTRFAVRRSSPLPP